jgi:hypothetical protein
VKHVTEQEWIECTDPILMLGFLRGKVSVRKLRLFGCACCRHIWDLFDVKRARDAVEVAELFADSQAAHQELRRACLALESVIQTRRAVQGVDSAGFAALLSASYVSTTDAMVDAAAVAEHAAFAAYRANYRRAVGEHRTYGMHLEAAANTNPESAAQCVLLREVIGNPFRDCGSELHPLVHSSRMLRQMAQSVYNENLFNDLPILADALEDAGCTNPDLLDHLRGPATHVRGCWALDLLLSKT